MGKLDKFLEFANRLGVTGLEQNQSISGNKKNSKKGKNPGLKSKKVKVKSDSDGMVFAADPVTINKDFAFKEDTVDDIAYEDAKLIEERDEDVGMANLEAEEETEEEVDPEDLETGNRFDEDVSLEEDEAEIVIDGEAELEEEFGDLIEKDDDLADLEEEDEHFNEERLDDDFVDVKRDPESFNGWDESTIDVERSQRKKEELESVIKSEREVEELEALAEEENEINKWIPLNAELDDVKEEYRSSNDWAENGYEEDERDNFEELVGEGGNQIVQDEDEEEEEEEDDNFEEMVEDEQDIVLDEDESLFAEEEESDFQELTPDDEESIEEESFEEDEPMEDDNARYAPDSLINEDNVVDDEEHMAEEDAEEETMEEVAAAAEVDSFESYEPEGKPELSEGPSAEDGERVGNYFGEEMEIKKELDINSQTSEESNPTQMDEDDEEFLNSISQMVPSNQCNICFKVFTASGSVGEHKLAVHEKVKFPCNLCKYSASSKRNLRGHMTRAHSQSSGEKTEPKVDNTVDVNITEFESHFMDEETRILKSVKARIKLLIQPLDETLSCTKCGKSVPNHKKWSLYRHAEKHLEDVAIPCNLCGVVSPSIITLQKHKAKVHKPKNLNSPNEDEINEPNEALEENTQGLSTGKNEGLVTDAEADHSCNQCGQKTSSLKQLMKHGKKHHPGTRYDCKECTNNFSSYGHLSRHMQDVHEGREFPCNQCDFQTTTNNKLVRHMKKIHLT